MRAIVRWYQAQGSAPRHRLIAADRALSDLAKEILAGTELDVLG